MANDRHPPSRLILVDDAAISGLVAFLEERGSFRTSHRRDRNGKPKTTEYVLSVTGLTAPQAKQLSAFIGYGCAIAPKRPNRTGWRYLLSGRIVVGEVLLRTVPLMGRRAPQRAEAVRLLKTVFPNAASRGDGVLLCAAPRCCRQATSGHALCGWHIFITDRAVVTAGACAACATRLRVADNAGFATIRVFAQIHRSMALCQACKDLIAATDARDLTVAAGPTDHSNGWGSGAEPRRETVRDDEVVVRPAKQNPQDQPD